MKKTSQTTTAYDAYNEEAHRAQQLITEIKDGLMKLHAAERHDIKNWSYSEELKDINHTLQSLSDQLNGTGEFAHIILSLKTGQESHYGIADGQTVEYKLARSNRTETGKVLNYADDHFMILNSRTNATHKVYKTNVTAIAKLNAYGKDGRRIKVTIPTD